VWDRIQRGTIQPKPMHPWRPSRWHRSAVQAELESGN
jgi:hypothetical protein